MKRITAISLLCVFIFNLMGFFLIFKVQQFRISQKATYYTKRDIPEDQLVPITVTQENEFEFDWKNRKEFRYKGVVYDVVKKEMLGNCTMIFYCIPDELATTLFAELDEFMEENSKDRDNESQEDVYQLFFSSIYALPQKLSWRIFPTGSLVSYSYLYHYTSPVFDIAGPPPKVV